MCPNLDPHVATYCKFFCQNKNNKLFLKIKISRKLVPQNEPNKDAPKITM
jgi:hypothetical protein